MVLNLTTVSQRAPEARACSKDHGHRDRVAQNHFPSEGTEVGRYPS